VDAVISPEHRQKRVHSKSDVKILQPMLFINIYASDDMF
jgi:hypothetical protein